MDDLVVAAHGAMAARDWATLRLMLHPYLHWRETDGTVLRGRDNVLAMLERVDAPDPPSAVEFARRTDLSLAGVIRPVDDRLTALLVGASLRQPPFAVVQTLSSYASRP